MARIAHLEAEALGAFIQCFWFPVAGRAVKGGMCGGRRGKGEDSKGQEVKPLSVWACCGMLSTRGE